MATGQTSFSKSLSSGSHATPLQTLLNRDAVRSYIAEVCPVPISPVFPLASDITDFLSKYTDNFRLGRAPR